MNCGFCGKPFDEDKSLPACRKCPVGSGCGLVRCPHCGYENPGTPGWIAFLRRRFGRDEEAVTPAAPSDQRAAVPSGLSLPVLHPRA